MAAKVTRDAWIEGWIYEEAGQCQTSDIAENPQWNTVSREEIIVRGSDLPLGSGYPSGNPKSYHIELS